MLFLAFLWHMHQPWYQDPDTGELALPWVRLHATKDYLDMAELIREFPAVRSVINVTPCLLEQVELYGAGVRDRHQLLCEKDPSVLTPPEVAELLQIGFMGIPEHMIHPYPRYYELSAKADRHQSFSIQEIRDVQVWSNLSWMDPRWRRESSVCAHLMAKGSRFSEEEKKKLLEEQVSLLGRVIPTYRSLQDSGQVELTTSPWGHPILPLLQDSDVARATNPGIPLPTRAFHFPEDVAWHLASAVAEHTRRFGRPPEGLWPSEGSVSEEILPAVSKSGLRWMATDEEILWKSLGMTPNRSAPRACARLYQPVRLERAGGDLQLVFRDHLLSDLIGFVYSSWPVPQATADFMNRLKAIEEAVPSGQPPPLVLVALDGENPWESYPEDGEPFLRSLYQALSDSPFVRCSTVSEYLKSHPAGTALKSLAPGSWIRGEFSTWIGHEPQNRAWEELLRVRRFLGPDKSKSIAIAEGSDWFWWLGPEHSSLQDPVFDRLFRSHVKAAYRSAGMSPPLDLDEPLKVGLFKPAVLPTGAITPVVDGEVSSYFEWLRAGELDLVYTGSAMARSKPCLTRLWWGCDANHLYLRLDPVGALLDASRQIVITERRFEARCALNQGIGHGRLRVASQSEIPYRVAIHKILEMALPLHEAGCHPGDVLNLTISIEQEGLILERYPEQGSFTLPLPPPTTEASLWSA